MLFGNIVDLFQTLAIVGLMVVLVYMNKGIRMNADSIRRLADTVSNWFNTH